MASSKPGPIAIERETHRGMVAWRARMPGELRELRNRPSALVPRQNAIRAYSTMVAVPRPEGDRTQGVFLFALAELRAAPALRAPAGLGSAHGSHRRAGRCARRDSSSGPQRAHDNRGP